MRILMSGFAIGLNGTASQRCEEDLRFFDRYQGNIVRSHPPSTLVAGLAAVGVAPITGGIRWPTP
jgi:hypothetical protein